MKLFYRQFKISVNIGQRRNEEISHILALQTSASEPVLQKLLHDIFLVRQANTVPDVSRRQHPQIFSQHAGAAAVIGHRNDSRYMKTTVFFQSPQQNGKSRSSSYHHDSRSLSRIPGIRRIFVFHGRILLYRFMISR